MLGEVAAALRDKGVNLRAVNAWLEGGEGVVRLVADKAAVAKRALAGKGWAPEEREVVELDVADRQGALAEAAQALGEAGINVEYVYLGTGNARKATVFLGVGDVAAALKALR
jgi:hypothetical protein